MFVTHPLFLTFLGRGFAAVGGVLLTLVVTTKFPIDEAGVFVTAFAVLASLALLCRYGFDTLVIKTLPTLSDSRAKDKFLAEANSFVLGLSLFICLFLFVLTWVLNLPMVTWLILCLAPFALISVHGAFLRASGFFGYGAFMEAGFASTFASLFILVLPLESVLQAGLILVVCCWLTLAVSLLALTRHGLLPQPVLVLPTKALVTKANNFGLIQVTSNLAQWGGLFIIAAYVSTVEASQTNVLFRFMAPLQFVFITLDFYLGPKFAQSSLRNPMSLQKVRLSGIRIALLLALPFAVVVLIAGKPLISLVLGVVYTPVYWPLVLLVGAHLFVLSLGSNAILLSVVGAEKAVRNATFVRAALTLILFFLLVPQLGVWAISLVYSFAICVEAIFFRLKADKLIQLN